MKHPPLTPEVAAIAIEIDRVMPEEGAVGGVDAVVKLVVYTLLHGARETVARLEKEARLKSEGEVQS
jgi:hypothetical protein